MSHSLPDLRITSEWEDRIGLLAEELVFGPGRFPSPAEVRASAEVGELRARWVAELREVVAGGTTTEEAFVRIREREVPRWESSFVAISPADRMRASGRRLFREVHATLQRHLAFETQWAYDVAALWIMMAVCARPLAVVFYVIFSERQGRGKSTALGVLSRLTGALNASDISPAALVHWLKDHPFAPVCIDEFDVPRDAERDSALQAVVRTGYQAEGRYDRWDSRRGKMDSCPTFGAKALGYRGQVDTATEDRVFVLPLRPRVPGREGGRLVTRNYKPDFGDLPERLRVWGGEAAAPEENWEGDGWLDRIEEVVGRENIGANRETQLTDVALRVCRLMGVDLTESLRAAFGLRREVASANASLDLEEAREVLSSFGTNRLTKDAPFVVVRQKEFMDRLNERRIEKGLRPLRDGAKLRNDLGIRAIWLSHPKNKATWSVPAKEWASLVGEETHPGGLPNPPNPPNLTDIDEWVNQVSQVSLNPPAPESGLSPDPGDLFGGRPTRADRARASFDKAGLENAERSP